MDALDKKLKEIKTLQVVNKTLIVIEFLMLFYYVISLLKLRQENFYILYIFVVFLIIFISLYVLYAVKINTISEKKLKIRDEDDSRIRLLLSLTDGNKVLFYGPFYKEAGTIAIIVLKGEDNIIKKIELSEEDAREIFDF